MIAANKLSRAKYSRLLGRILPKVPKTEAENERLLEEVNQLMDRDKLSPEEGAILELLAVAIEAFEKDCYPVPKSAPHELLRFLMEENDLRQRDMLEIFGARSTVSEVLAGKRAITKHQAVALGKRFAVEPAAFIDLPA
ncbi:MAG: helix-turn-helix domain-containing protein [Blastocatellia bacterium]